MKENKRFKFSRIKQISHGDVGVQHRELFYDNTVPCQMPVGLNMVIISLGLYVEYL